MTASLAQVKEDLLKLANPKKAIVLQGFFKTKKGEYGEGDIFLGITVPAQRIVATKNQDVSINDIQDLLKSEIHEERFTALEILVIKFSSSNDEEKSNIFNFYLKNARRINNWDLVDTSAPYIAGKYLLNKDKSILHDLAKSDNLWERRISIVSTYEFIRNDNFKDTLKISEILLKDNQDLIHKAVGWMLREIGKRDLNVLEGFLIKNYKVMPRTMLRYAIERFPEERRKMYLKGEVK